MPAATTKKAVIVPQPIPTGAVNLAAASAIPANPAERRSDLGSLHPQMREAAERLVARCFAEGIPFKPFETYRSPIRQQWLFAQGRTRPGNIVTKAKPWTSYHQYGLAVDFVLLIDGKWSWDDTGAKAAWWKRMIEIGKSLGLEALSFEKPHLQIAGLEIADLQAGKLPDGGDDVWASNFEASVITWDGAPAAPPVLAMRGPIVEA